jgi:hypothetical protein
MPYPRQLALRRRRLHQTYWFLLRRLRDLETDLQKVAPDPDVVRATQSRAVSVRETDA